MAAHGILRQFSASIKPFLTYSVRCQWKIQTASYAAMAKKGKAAPVKKKTLDVETDPEILCSRLCGGNIYLEGEDPVLGPDSDYPEWLWSLHIDREPIPLEEMSEEDPRYWKRLKTMTIRQNNQLRKVKKF